MRLRHIALGCALTGGLGFLALPAGTALASTTSVASTMGLAGTTGIADVSGAAGAAGRAGATGDAAAARLAGTRPGADTAGRGDAKPGAKAARPAATRRGAKTGGRGDGKRTGTTAGTAGHGRRAVRPEISVSAPVTDNPYGAKVTLTVTLRQSGTDRAVSLYATPVGGTRTLVTSGTVDAEGKWYVPYTITTATTFTAVLAGGAHGASVRASRTLYADARVTDRLAGAYRTSKGGDGIVYDVFHGTGTLTLHATVAPDKHGECLEPETEQYDKGSGWHVDTRYGCDKLDGASHDTAPFSLSQAVGDRYRIRGDFQHSAADKANLNAQGPWLYFIVTK